MRADAMTPEPLDPARLAGWSLVPAQPESDARQTDLFDTGRGLEKRQRADFERGQDFLFELRGDDERDEPTNR